MHMLLTLAVLVTAPIHYSDPILNLQLDRWQTLNEQCRGDLSYNCKNEVNKITKLVKIEILTQLKPRVRKD
jgi:hypothetical protein